MDRSSWVLNGLENLWTSIEALSENPMVDELGLASEADDDFDRAMALIEVILQAGQRVKVSGNGRLFALLNRAFGLEGNIKRRYQITAARPTMEELVAQASLMSVDQYERLLQQALRVLDEQLRELNR